mgnify:CR=1 FL=1
MAFVGDSFTDQRVQDAIDYISRHWNDMDSDPGWQNHNKTMYCLMKGFEAFGIEVIEVEGVPVDWFQDFIDDLLARQDPIGFWPWELWGGEWISTI